MPATMNVQLQLQNAYDFLAQEPDSSVDGALYYHGYAEHSYVSERLRENGDFLLCKTYREIDNKGRIIQLLCLAVHGPTEIGYFTILIGPNRQYYLSTQGFNNMNELVTHFRTTGKSLPNGSNELFTLRRARLRQPELLEHGRVELHEAVGDLDLYTVYRGTFRMGNDAVPVAVKKLKADFVGDPKKKAKFLTEAYSLLKIRPHKNICKLYGISTFVDPIYAVFEFIPKGTLKSYLRKTADITKERKLAIILDVATGAAHLEECGIIHRQLMARSCFIGADGTVKITDFDLALEKKALEMKGEKLEAVPLPMKWLAPEILKQFAFSTKSDVWAFGVLCWEVYADGGADPYPGMTNQEVRLMLLEGTGRRMVIPDEFPNFIRKVLEKCWEEIWCERPSFKRLVRYLEKVQNTMAAELEQVAAEEGAPDGDGVPADPDGNDGVDDQGSDC